MLPTIGRIVVYKPNQEEKAKMKALGNGVCNVQDQLPAIVTAVWGAECVNLKVLLDGQGDIWATSRRIGDQEGTWSWPVINK